MWRVLVAAGLTAACRPQGPKPSSSSAPEPHPAPSAPTAPSLLPAHAPHPSSSGAQNGVPPLASPSAGVPLLHVTTTDLTVADAGATTPLFSYASWARAAFERDLALLAEPDGELPPLTIREIDVKPVAWLGLLLGLSEVTETSMPDHEAHPAAEARLVTLAIDASGASPPKIISLRDYYDDRTLYRALAADPLVKRTLASVEKPGDLSALIQALADAPPVLAPLCASFPTELLSRFSFHHLTGSKVAVHLGLPGNGLCRDALGSIELVLPVPVALQSALADTRRGTTGFLADKVPAGLPVTHLRLMNQPTKRAAQP
jgi:hypothetical protein